MFKVTRQIAPFIPTSMAGLALGIASLGRGWSYLQVGTSVLQYVSAIVASLLLLLVLSKFILQPKLLNQDLRHPILGSTAPTFAMALMVISISLNNLLPAAGVALWWFALILHGLLLTTFIYHRVKRFRMTDMLPSCFVPFAGIGVAAISFPAARFQPFAEGVLWFGILCYLLLVPVIIYRLVYCDALPEHAKPTLAVLAAPASVCLTGYLTVVSAPSQYVVVLLLAMALIKTGVVYGFSLRLVRLPFSPGYASFTFPLAIGATALFKVQEQCIAWQSSELLIALLGALGMLELLIASLVIVYVSCRYLHYYLFALQRELTFA
ncbi:MULTISPECIES: TDT family transporter [Marinomonas]|uniref:TDT family transporter n=1 Tax=Marinomonas TaxID=28253 RepID=UPI00105467FE|nr:TDT family transporter [Marinomonas sp. KMM3893]